MNRAYAFSLLIVALVFFCCTPLAAWPARRASLRWRD